MESLTWHGNWYVEPIEFPDAEEYINDINNIAFATTGFIHAWESNLFFDEASQLIVNAIKLFQQGYFDCAFYSLRQSVELSIGTIYLTANPSKEENWRELKKGFESGFMSQELKNKDQTFQDIRNKLSKFFNSVLEKREKMNKYIHKQGYASFYKVTSNPFLIQDKGVSKELIVKDFKEYLTACIGAVAIYRLSIDALPIVLMDEEMRMRSGDLITEPYTEEFVEKYIGKENLNAFKTTDIYNDFCKSLCNNEKQNEAVYDLIHYQYYDRNRMNEYESQLHLCSFTDRVAMCLFSISDKISQVFVDGIHWYHSNVLSTNNGNTTLGLSYFESLFPNENECFNMYYKNAFLSRCQINGTDTYFEHNVPLKDNEIECIGIVALKLSELANQIENNLSSVIDKLSPP